ncbi:MobF family relaxase [Actinomycetospora sp.]|uniref:MobF family relaxase n=1 Tax=Actinomycetospora sp. TaxID=1872135 RepID=UPI002F3FA6CC
MLRINAIGAGAVDYLLKGCDDPGHDHREVADRADSAGPGADQYFARAIERGEPAGVWMGRGWEALGLDIEVGGQAAEDDVRAIFGQLRRPDSTVGDPAFIGSKPRSFAGYEDRLDKLKMAEPDASPERLREMEREAATSGQRAVAYYDLTFSPVKSISLMYAAYMAAGLHEEAAAVRAAHDDAVAIALGYAEEHVAYTRFGLTEMGREYVQAEGLAAVVFAHHTSREGEPQLHTHGGVLNRVGTGDGRIGALDGKAFRPFKEAIATAYERGIEQHLTDRLGLRFVTRPDGKAREIAGMDPDLMAEASTRRGQVTARVEQLVERYRQRHGGREPGARARRDMANDATLDTRATKPGLAGPAAVAAWVDRDRGRRGRLVATVDEVDMAAMAAVMPVAASPERVAQALAAGLADVQAQYSTWQLGNLVDAIDHHLGDVSTLGVPAAERPAALEALARSVIDPAAGFGVVQLTGHEPVEVPGALMRRDGRPTWRPHEERRFATADHLGTEAGVLSFTQTRGAQRTDLDRETRMAVPERGIAAVGEPTVVLERAGLSADQDAAVRGIVGSGRHGDVLVGPAGTGKSRTVGALAAVWSEQVGGTVYGIAAAQIATSNLAGDGLTALNITRFLDAVTPDPVTGAARRPLGSRDLIVVDEASMSSTADLAAISTAAARAGAKVVYVGDPHQLDAVGAGGLFSHLVETLPGDQVHTLDQPHRFTNGWEAEASLQLRAGDVRAVEAYADRGRLMAGTVEEMAAAARRGWLADRLDGLDAVLVVGSNTTAADMAAELRTELVHLGRVEHEQLAQLGDGNPVGIGDVVEARRNAWQLQVDPSPEGEAEAVMNRGRYTILGRGDDGTILGRDRHGAVAHLPEEYLRDHAALGYASTEYGAEGITADAAHGLVDRAASREAVYVQVTRGREHNYLYLVAEREPDEHEPQRVAQVAAERLTELVQSSNAQQAASAVRDHAQEVESSGPALLTSLNAALEADGHTRYLDTLREKLGDRAPGRHDPTTGRLLAALTSAELAGHDADALLGRAIESRSLDDVDSVAETLRHRVRGLEMTQEPQRQVDAADWTSRLPQHDGEVPDYGREVAARLTERQRDLGDRVATEQPAWVVSLGEAPDPAVDAEARDAWRDRAGLTALYREHAGIDPEQSSLGAPPARDRVLERALYDAALDATRDSHEPEASGGDWRAAEDAELYATRERWVRELEQAPSWVADELADTHSLARGYREDAAIERARAESLPETDPGREQVADDAARSALFAEQYEAEAAELEVAHQRRASWWESSTPQRDADVAAADELDRRGLPPERVVEPDVDEPEPVQVEEPEPEPQPAQPEVDVAADLAAAREAQRQAELEAIERDAAREAAAHEPEVGPEPEPEPSLDELAQERELLAPEREPSQTEVELDEGPEMEI